MSDFQLPVVPDDHPASPASHVPQRASPLDVLCDAVLSHLKQRLPGSVSVEHFPDNPGSYDLAGRNAAVLVLYDGSRFDAEGLLGAQGLNEDVRLAIVLLVRTFQGDGGAYQYLADIRTALHGQSLGGGTALRPVETELDNKSDDNVFQYRMVFETRLRAVPSSNTGPRLPGRSPSGANP